MSRPVSLLCLCAAFLLASCASPPEPTSGVSQSQEDGPRPGDVTPPAPPVSSEGEAVPAALDEATLAGLASADAMDGAADQVVSKCAGCRLMMDGKEEHSVAVGEYTLHLCSATCRDHFVGDLPSGLSGLVAAATPASEPAAEAPAPAEKPAGDHDHGAHGDGAH